ncbi:MAG: aspartate ammonia-lyase, partial [Planctomycetes bacterium]|nr:aspartate ammonia-lyase [Planctomycetota bacterium]
TSTNMNVNEVIANRALELLGRPRGDYATISPNDHVNRGQSTNDTFPTALHLASLLALPPLYEAADELADALDRKGGEFHDVVKSGRTHLQDAMPVRLGQEFHAYASAIRRARRGIARASEDLYEVALGGTAVGTGTNAPPGFRRGAVEILADETGLPLRPAADPFEALQSRYASAHVSGALRDLALELCRIANDLRLLASGPTTGLAEIRLPAVQPGSSIMPGKVNPVIAECVNMICFQAIGNDAAIAQAVGAGQLDLNVMMPVIAATFLKTAGILANGMRILAARCVAGIRADAERCFSYLEKNPSLATLLNPAIGYLRAAEVAKEALARGAAVRDIVREKGLLPPEEIDRLFSEAALLWEGERADES